MTTRLDRLLAGAAPAGGLTGRGQDAGTAATCGLDAGAAAAGGLAGLIGAIGALL